MKLLDAIKRLLEAERRASEMETATNRLVFENDLLTKEKSALETRAANLEASLEAVLNLFGREWTSPDQQAIMRTARVILEDESWKR